MGIPPKILYCNHSLNITLLPTNNILNAKRKKNAVNYLENGVKLVQCFSSGSLWAVCESASDPFNIIWAENYQ